MTTTPHQRQIALFALAAVLSFGIGPEVASAQRPLSVSRPAADNSVEAEFKSFTLADGYAVNLFADETNGVANPICMRWDPAGRLWVLCTWAYPQLKPDQRPDDKLLILEDTDGDGRADRTKVFADALNMPTGFALGHGGAYVAQGTDLLHLQDTDGDDQADRRRVVLTGFGTGDTHQNINSLTWSPGGELFFCQGLHAFARVETPWGIVRLDEHGVWRLRPRRLQLHAFRGGSGQNPWGIAFGPWGEPLVKGNNSELSELLPVMVHTTRRHAPLDIGRTKIKSMIATIVDSPHLPDDIQGDVLIAGYFGRLVDRLKLTTDGAGHKATLVDPLMRSTHNAFRPVDIQIGPDGAIYVADWFNPIIGHYQASFRHPDRDKTHGRIWRVTAKGRPLAKAPDLARLGPDQICPHLESDWAYVRHQAKRRLADLTKDQAISAVTKWGKGLDPGDPRLEHHLYEAIGVFESHEVVDQDLLKRLLEAKDPRARAYATRVVGRWHDRLETPLKLLDRSATDTSARVRLEAVVACSQVPRGAAMVVAAKASRGPVDRFLAAGLSQCVHALAPHWLPALQAGTVQFERPADLVYVLQAYGGKDVAGQVRRLVASDTLARPGRRQLLQLLARTGTAADLRLVLDHALDDPQLLPDLATIARDRPIRPTGDVTAALKKLLDHDQADVRSAAIRLVGLWDQRQLAATVEAAVRRDGQDEQVLAAAIESWMKLAPDEAAGPVRTFITKKHPPPVRLAALSALSHRDLDAAVVEGLKLLSGMKDADAVDPVLSTLMQRQGASAAMVRGLAKVPVSVDDAKLISRYLNAAGHGDRDLATAVRSAMGAKAAKLPTYSPDLVRRLAGEVTRSGDATAGRKVFRSSVTSCVACHHVEGFGERPAGFARGPDLTALAAGLPLELIIESVIWPRRQIKEGYEATTLILRDGRVITGYLLRADKSSTHVRDLTTGRTQNIPTASINQRATIGTLMPEGLTAFLTDKELRDLLAYLADLKGNDQPAEAPDLK